MMGSPRHPLGTLNLTEYGGSSCSGSVFLTKSMPKEPIVELTRDHLHIPKAD